MITVKKTSKKDFSKHFKHSSVKFQHGVRRGFDINGQMLVKDVRYEMTHGRKSGNTYKIYRGLGGRKLKSPRLHIASTPQEYPAVITGALRKTVDYKVRGSTRLEFGAGNGFMIYPKILEERNQFLKRTFEKHKNQFKTNLNREIRKSLGI